MKKGLLTLLVCCFTAALYGQAPAWLWAKSAGGTDYDFTHSIVADGAGNSYVVGSFSSPTITFGTTTLTNTGSEDIFLVKYDPSGTVLWAKGVTGGYIDRGLHVALDGSGNVYIAGDYYSSTLNFGSSVTLTNSTITSTFVAKYNSAGTVLWAKTSGGSSIQTFCNGFAVDAGGASYVTGWIYNNSSSTNNPISFGSITLYGTGLANDDIFVAKYSASGAEVWAKRPAGAASDGGGGLAADKFGNCYLTGGFSSTTLDFGNGVSLTNTAGVNHIFTTKYNAAGNAVWARTSTGAGGEQPYGAGVDSTGAFYVAGEFITSTVGFGAVTLTNAGARNAFVVKYDTSGTVAWATNTGGASDVLVYSMAVAANGESYLCGNFTGISTFGSTSLTAAGGGDGYVVKLNNGGAAVWAKGVHGTASETVFATAVDPAGTCYATGGFYSPSVVFGATTLTNTGTGRTVFTAKLAGCTASPLQPGIVAGSATPCAGSPGTYSVTPVAGATSYVWTLPNGWTGTSTTASIVATPGTTGGSISVAAVNACGTSAASMLTISSISAAPSPVITQAGSTLSTTAAFSSYQWYYNGSPIAGATSQSYTATQDGSYYVEVTNAGACSGQSNTISFLLGIEERGNHAGFAVYPNPVRGDALHVRLPSGAAGVITLSDLAGRMLRTAEVSGGGYEQTIDTKGLAAGVYLLSHTDGGATKTVRLIKE